MSKWEKWMYWFFLATCVFDGVRGRTTWATFCGCGILVLVWILKYIHMESYLAYHRHELKRMAEHDPNYVHFYCNHGPISANTEDQA